MSGSIEVVAMGTTFAWDIDRTDAIQCILRGPDHPNCEGHDDHIWFFFQYYFRTLKNSMMA